jgi:hypothetical protein
MATIRSILRIKHLLFLSLVAIVSCKSPIEAPIVTSLHRMGSGGGASVSAADYWYPHQRGLRITYSNTDTLFNANNSFTVTHGSNDTLRSLGYLGFSPTGDSLFAVVVTYEVVSGYAGRGVMTLKYLPGSSGAFIDGTSSLSGEVTTSVPTARGVAFDSVAGALAGRIKTVADGYAAGTYTRSWQKDTIFYTSIGDSVVLWNRQTPTAALKPFKYVFLRSITLSDSWRTAADLDVSTYTVASTSIAVTVPAGSYTAVQLSANSPQYNLPIDEEKYFTQGIGLIRQQDSWRVTTDGISYQTHKLIREASVIVKDETEQ